MKRNLLGHGFEKRPEQQTRRSRPPSWQDGRRTLTRELRSRRRMRKHESLHSRRSAPLGALASV